MFKRQGVRLELRILKVSNFLVKIHKVSIQSFGKNFGSELRKISSHYINLL